MKLLDGATITTSDFWYDLFEGYIVVEKVLPHDDDLARVLDAMSVLQDFRKSTESITEEI